MKEKTYFLPVFFLSLGMIFFVMLLSSLGIFGFVTNSVQSVMFPLSAFIVQYSPSGKVTELDSLKKENARLLQLLAQKQEVEADNVALRDQFQQTTPSPKKLLPADVVGMPNSIPHVTFPDTIIIHAGKRQGVGIGSVVIVGQMVVGKVSGVSVEYSQVQLLTSKQSSFSVQTSTTHAIGVARGLGNGEILVDNILLSDSVVSGDSIVTLGDQNLSGVGYPPGLIVGKIMSIDKNPSNLFQKARVVPLLPLDSLTKVFVLFP